MPDWVAERGGFSRLLRSVWDRKDNDVFLIGPQHFDLSISEVRDKLTEISGMRDVIAKDLWDGNQSAHAQIIDLKAGKESATQVGSLLLTARLSTAVNAIVALLPLADIFQNLAPDGFGRIPLSPSDVHAHGRHRVKTFFAPAM